MKRHTLLKGMFVASCCVLSAWARKELLESGEHSSPDHPELTSKQKLMT